MRRCTHWPTVFSFELSLNLSQGGEAWWICLLQPITDFSNQAGARRCRNQVGLLGHHRISIANATHQQHALHLAISIIRKRSICLEYDTDKYCAITGWYYLNKKTPNQITMVLLLQWKAEDCTPLMCARLPEPMHVPTLPPPLPPDVLGTGRSP